MRAKQNTAINVPVRLLDTNGDPVTGVAFGSVTAVVGKSDKSETTLTVTGSDWEEANNGLAGSGLYWLLIPSTATNLLGSLVFRVVVAGAVDYIGVLEVSANLESDIYTRLGTPAGASIAADIAANGSDPNDIAAAVWGFAKASLTTSGSIGQALRDGLRTMLNRAKINSVTKKLEVYAEDGTTIAFSYDLKDLSGSATAENATERIPA